MDLGHRLSTRTVVVNGQGFTCYVRGTATVTPSPVQDDRSALTEAMPQASPVEVLSTGALNRTDQCCGHRWCYCQNLGVSAQIRQGVARDALDSECGETRRTG
jgi:hypothetical protein